MKKVLEWIAIAVLLLILLAVAELALGIVFGLVSLSFAFIGGLFSLLFSKAGLTLIAVGLIAYIITNNRRQRQIRY